MGWLKRWLLNRYKKLFEAEIMFVAKKSDVWLIYLNREIPLSWWVTWLLYGCWKGARNNRVVTLPLTNGRPDPRLFSPYQESIEKLLMPGQQISIIYWQPSGKIEKIYPLMNETSSLFLETNKIPVINVDTESSSSSQ